VGDASLGVLLPRLAASILSLAMMGGSAAAFSESTDFNVGTIEEERPAPPAGDLHFGAGKSRAPMDTTTTEHPRRGPTEPDRAYRAPPARSASPMPDAASLDRLLDMFRTESVTSDGKSEIIEIPAETRERILEHFRDREQGGRAPGANAPDEKPQLR
jgi:hypothetical protein